MGEISTIPECIVLETLAGLHMVTGLPTVGTVVVGTKYAAVKAKPIKLKNIALI